VQRGEPITLTSLLTMELRISLTAERSAAVNSLLFSFFSLYPWWELHRSYRIKAPNEAARAASPVVVRTVSCEAVS